MLIFSITKQPDLINNAFEYEYNTKKLLFFFCSCSYYAHVTNNVHYASTINRYPSHPHPVLVFLERAMFFRFKNFKDFCLLIGFTALTSWLSHVLTSLTSFCDHLDKMYSLDLCRNHGVHEDQPSLIWRKFSKYDE